MSTPRSASQGPVQSYHQNGCEAPLYEGYASRQTDRRRRKSQNPLSVPDDGFFASASQSALSYQEVREANLATKTGARQSGVSQGIAGQTAAARYLEVQSRQSASEKSSVRPDGVPNGDVWPRNHATNDDLMFFENSDNDSMRPKKARRRNVSASKTVEDRPQQDVAFFDYLLNDTKYPANAGDKPTFDRSMAGFDDMSQQRVSRRRKSSNPRQCENPAAAGLFVSYVNVLQPVQAAMQHSCAQSSSSSKASTAVPEQQLQSAAEKQATQHFEPLLEALDFSSVRFPLNSCKELGAVRACLKANMLRQRAFRRRVLLAAVLSRLGEDEVLISYLESVAGTCGEALLRSLADEPELAVESLICQGRADLALAYAVRHKLPVMDVLAAHIIDQAERGASASAAEHLDSLALAETADLRSICAARQQLLQCARGGFADEQELVALYQKALQEKHFLYASALQIAAGFVLEPCARFSDVLSLSIWPALTSAYQRAICADNAAFKPNLELVRFCEIIEFAHFVALQDGSALRRPRSFNVYDLQALPFCPFLLEHKLALFAHTDAYYAALCIRQLKLILQSLSARKIGIKEGTLRKSQFAKFVAFSSQEAHDWATTQGQQLYNARNGDFGAAVPTDSELAGVFDVEAYVQASDRKTVGQRLGDALTAGLGKLLGTGVE